MHRGIHPKPPLPPGLREREGHVRGEPDGVKVPFGETAGYIMQKNCLSPTPLPLPPNFRGRRRG